MPSFVSPFQGNDAAKKLNKDELLRCIRFAIAAEYEAVQLYEQIATAASDSLASVVLASIAREELVHAGELLDLLKKLSPDEGAAYEEGQMEVNAMRGKIR